MLFKVFFIIAFVVFVGLVSTTKKSTASKKQKLAIAITATIVEVSSLPLIIDDKKYMVEGIVLAIIFLYMVIKFWKDWKKS